MKKVLSLVLLFVMLLGVIPMTAFAAEDAEATETVVLEHIANTDRLCNSIVVNKGQLASGYDGSIIDSDIYGYVVNYPLKKGHVLSISDTSYVFSVRKWENGNYSTMLKQATTAKYTATEDMTVAMLIRKPDKSAVTAEELASIVIYDSQFGMIGVEGSVKRFTVEAETIDGGTQTTRAAIFLPDSYSEESDPTRLIVMTNGHSAHLTDSVWNKNSAENVQVIQNYLSADYAVWVVDNTAASTSQTPDLGCPQLVDSYFKAYEYIQNNLNVEQKFSVHARSFGTFAAVRIMREHPELIKCAVMTGSRVSIKAEWPGIKKAHVAKRFGFTDTTGATYESDKLVGYDPYTDVNDVAYTLPPTFWMLAEGDSTAKPSEFIEKLTTHGNDVTLKIYSDISHTGICTLNTEETFGDALAYLKKHQAEVHKHSYSAVVNAPTCTEQGYTTYTCACGDSYVDNYKDATGHTYENGICIWCADWNICWEVGTIAAANGENNANSTRIRTLDYLQLSDFAGVCVNKGYQLTWLAYDADKKYIGNGTSSLTGYWQPSGQSIATADIQDLYVDAVYFRLALKNVSGSNMTLEDAERSGVTFVAYGQALPEPEFELDYENSMNIGSWQDGAIWNGKLFVLGAAGTGAVYDLKNLCRLATFALDSADVLKPHANSVCFGSTYYSPGDEYPLLYVNIYNNYSSAEDRMEGTCCVYRFSETDSGFATELVQVIRIGFVEDLSLWKSKENTGDVRPYGNFLVDTDDNKLYAYVMRDAAKATRFFKFDLPKLTDGIYSETYGCNVVTLESTDIEGQFDTEYFNYLQGGTYSNGMILSAEGFRSGGSAEPALRIVDLQTGTVSATYYMANSGLTTEPEVVCIDPATGLLYYAPADGIVRILSIPDVHFHGYTTAVTAPTCTEQGYTTYTCKCGDSYVDNYTDASGHSFGKWVEVTAPACSAEGQDMRTCACGYEEYRDTRISGSAERIQVSNPLDADYFADKTIVCVGDSITNGHGVKKGTEDYVTLLGEALGANMVNRGSNGVVLCTGGSRTCAFSKLDNLPEDTAVVTIMLGINDFSAAYSGAEKSYYDLGTFGTDDTATIYGAAKMWCERIVELQATDGYEDTLFVFVTPVICSWNISVTSARDWNQSKTNVFGCTLRQYCTAIMEVCAHYGVPVLDLNMYSGMYYHSEEDNNVSYFGGDGVHPGAGGHVMIADAFREFLLENYTCEERTVTDCGHSYEVTIAEPTCTEVGYTTYCCPECYYSYEADYIDSSGHDCVAGVCTFCGEDTVLAALEGNTLSLSGTLEDGVRIFAAGYDDTGRFSGVKEFAWQGDALETELPAWETVKLFFSDENRLPLRQSIILK